MPGGESIAREAAAQAEGEVEDAVEEVDRERGIPPGMDMGMGGPIYGRPALCMGMQEQPPQTTVILRGSRVRSRH